MFYIEKGKLTIPSEDVVKVIGACKKIIRQNNHFIFVKQNIKYFSALKIINAVIDYAFIIYTILCSNIKETKKFSITE